MKNNIDKKFDEARNIKNISKDWLTVRKFSEERLLDIIVRDHEKIKQFIHEQIEEVIGELERGIMISIKEKRSTLPEHCLIDIAEKAQQMGYNIK